MVQLISVVLILGSIAYGWILNIMYLVNMEVFVWSAKTIIGVGGVFVVPVGAVMGLFVW